MISHTESRVKAYYYIMEKVKKLELLSDDRLSKIANGVDYVSLSDLIGLKEGNTDPSPPLLANLKKLLKGVANEKEIDQYLVQPFHKTKHEAPRNKRL